MKTSSGRAADWIPFSQASLLRKGTGTRVEINRSVRAFLTTDRQSLLPTSFISHGGLTDASRPVCLHLLSSLPFSVGALFLCLLITDFMSSVGFATNYHFVAQGLSTIGEFVASCRFLTSFADSFLSFFAGSACSFQATMYIVAIVAVGYWNVCIAAQTFSVLVLRVKTPRWLLVLVM